MRIDHRCLNGRKFDVARLAPLGGDSFDHLESDDDNLRFFSEGGTVMQMENRAEAKVWLEGVVFDDPEVSDKVEKILHPERFNGQGIAEIKPFSVLKELKRRRKQQCSLDRRWVRVRM